MAKPVATCSKCGWRMFGAVVDCPRCSDASRQRRDRVAKAVAKRARLIGWLQFFRLPSEDGIGDTAHRLNMRSCRHPDAHAELHRLLSQCSCERIDAVARLNREHPYSTPTEN